MNSRLLKIYRYLVFVVLVTIVFAPFGDLASMYLPEKIANQVARISPKTETASAHTDDVYIFITVASDSADTDNLWDVPLDWNSASNSIEVIGGGGTGGDANAAASGAGGGGGGGYGKITNLTLTPGAIGGAYFNVGASGSLATGNGTQGGDGGHTWFGTSTNTTFALCDATGPTGCVSAEGGEGGHSNTAPLIYKGGTGGGTGSTSYAVGFGFAGGNGGLGYAVDQSGGGGGAAGPGGAGKNGGNGSSAGQGDGGGGGGGSGGGSSDVGGNGTTSTGGNGGPGYLGGAGGSGNTGGDGAPGVNVGSGGGGGDAGAFSGGNGGIGQQWTAQHGSGGGGGGGGDGGSIGGRGGNYGGGGGGGADCITANNPNCRGGDGIIVIRYTPRAVQSHFQWFNDDGALDSATSVSAEDIMASGSEALQRNTTYRLRLQVANQKNYSAPSFTNDKFRLEMTRASTSFATCNDPANNWTWRTVPTTATLASHAFEISNAQFTDGASTSSQLLSTPTGATTFTNGYGLDTRATSGYQMIADDAFTEIEWAIKPTSNANTSANYCFRAGWITNDLTTPDTRASMSYSKIASASVQEVQAATFTQNDFEWFYNADSITPGGSLMGTENTHVELGTTAMIARLRMNVTVGTTNLSASSQQFKLQYYSDFSGTWTDVAGSGAKWNFYNNSSVADPTDITDGGTLVSTSTNTARQTYQESNPTVVNPRSASVGNNMEYDWSLDPGSATPGRLYYFRMVKSDGSLLDYYTNYPTLRIEVKVNQWGGGGGSSNPTGQGDSGGGQANKGGGQSAVAGATNSTGNGDDGGGTVQTGGDEGSGGSGASPVIFNWLSWLGSWLKR